MDQKNLFYTFIKYVGLNIGSMLGMSCYILADTFFIANGVGIHGLTALNLAIPIYAIMLAIGVMLGVGTSCKYSIAMAQGNEFEGNCVFSHGLICSFVFGILLLLVGVFGSSFLSRLMGADETTFELTKIYLQTCLSFAPFFILNSFFNMMVKNDYNPKLSMIAMLCSSLSNILLDYIFIYPLKWGMFGAALATGIAPIVGLCVLFLHKKMKRNHFHRIRGSIRISYIGNILTLGIPAFISETAAAVVVILFNLIMIAKVGNIGVAAYAIVANLAIVVIGIFNGISQGIQPIVSENYGKQNMKNVYMLLKYGIVTTLLTGTFLYVFLFFNTDIIISVFNKSRLPELVSLASSGIKLYFIGIFFAGINILSIFYDSSIENIKISFVTSLLRSGIIIIPTLLVMSSIWGIMGIWLSYPVSEAIICIIRVIIKYSKQELKSVI